jgi:hypothetical protein
MFAEEHRTRPALAFAASVLRAGQRELVAQHTQQSPGRFDVEVVSASIHIELDLHAHLPTEAPAALG